MTTEPQVPAAPLPRVWPAFTAVALAVALTIVLTIGLFIAVLVARGEDASDLETFFQATAELAREPGIFGWSILLTVIANATLALGGALLSPASNRLRWQRGVLTGGVTMLIGVVGLLCLSNLETALLELLGIPVPGSLAEMAQMIATAPPFTKVILCLLSGVAAPLAEELLFRGYLQTRLVERWGRWPGIGITSVLFGLVHFSVWHSAFACVLGIYLGWLTEVTGSIRAAVVAHMANNLVWVTLVAGGVEIPLPAGLVAPIAAFVGAWSVVALQARGRAAAAGTGSVAGKLVTVRTYPTSAEAHVARLALEQRGIVVFIVEDNSPLLPWGRVRLVVPGDRATAAEEVLGAASRRVLSADDAE
jgi:membrane protease YdiL (CAAX protease family)